MKPLSNLGKFRIVLGSASPRRHFLLSHLGIDFETYPDHNHDESYPENLSKSEIPVYLAREKAKRIVSLFPENALIITADTIVWLDGKVINKPAGQQEAIQMLTRLSGRTHEVVTGVCLCTASFHHDFHVNTLVRFAHLTREEIEAYVERYKPLDKAGAYGIQEWIGYIGVESIEGSYFNVMGLPVQKLYQELKKL